MLQLLKEDGTLAGGIRPPLAPDELRTVYRAMVQIRLLDKKMLALQRQGRISFYGPSTGQEAAIIGSALALSPTDWIYPALREGGAALMRGFPLDKYIAQLFGNASDLLKGRQMPCHYACRDVNQVSWSTCVGNQLPQAVGTALAARSRGDSLTVLAYLGDGATSEGDFHWAMNFAGVFHAPVIFLCQNNHWAISVPVAQQTASQNIAIKAQAYGIEGLQVDGNDVLAVYSATRRAVDKARGSGGPTLIEAFTYRIGAHSSSDDPSRYQDEAVTEQWRSRDPIARLKRYLIRKKIWNQERDHALREELLQDIQEAVGREEVVGPPERESLFEDVYSVVPWHLQEQMIGLGNRSQ